MSVMRLSNLQFRAVRSKLLSLFQGGEPATGVRQSDILAVFSGHEEYLRRMSRDLRALGRFKTPEEATEAVDQVTPPHNRNDYKHERPAREFITGFSSDLRRLNDLAYALRYGRTSEELGRIEEPGPKISDVQLFKALQAISYNSIESEESRGDRLEGAWETLQDLLPRVGRKAITETSEYKAAGWRVEKRSKKNPSKENPSKERSPKKQA